MATIVYGTRVFVKEMGYVGARVECPVCSKNYKMSIVRFRKWAHLEYIPLFPVKTTYFKMCPICAHGQNMTGKDAKAELTSVNPQEYQKFEFYSKHIIANKPKGIMATDQSFEFWAKDLSTGEEICIGSNLTKDNIKEMKKERGLKSVKFIDIK